MTELFELRQELVQEPNRGNLTCADVEESDGLARFLSWLAIIGARDYFAATRGAAALDAVNTAEAALAAFEEAVMRESSCPIRLAVVAAGVLQVDQHLLATVMRWAESRVRRLQRMTLA